MQTIGQASMTIDVVAPYVVLQRPTRSPQRSQKKPQTAMDLGTNRLDYKTKKSTTTYLTPNVMLESI